MKKLVLSILAIAGVTSLSFAQDAELKSAQTNIQNKKYIAAFDDLNKAKKAVTELISTELASVLPASLGELKMAENEYGSGMESQGVSVNKTYRKPAVKKEAASSDGDSGQGDMGSDSPEMMMDPGMMGNQEEMRVTITTSMMMANEVMNAHSMGEENMGGSEAGRAVRIKGYRALVKNYGGEGDPDMGMGQPETEVVMAIVGGAFVQVESVGLEKGQAEKLMNLIDFDKLKGIVGE